MYIQSLTSGIMEAVANAEVAIVAALSHRYAIKHSSVAQEQVKQDMTASMRHRVHPATDPYLNANYHDDGADAFLPT